MNAITAADITALAAVITAIGGFVVSLARLRQTDDKIKNLAIITEQQQRTINQQGKMIDQINEHSQMQADQMAECYAQLNSAVTNLQRIIADTKPLPKTERGW